MALVANLSLPDWDEWRLEMLERRRRRWRERVRDRVRVRVVANAQVSIEGVSGAERAEEKREEGEEGVVEIREVEEEEEGEGGEKDGGEMIEGDETVGVEEEGEENEAEMEAEENEEEVREEVKEEENEEVGEEVREEENGEEVREEVKEEENEEKVRGEVKEEENGEVVREEENGEVGEEVREEVKEEENGEVGEELREEVNEEVGEMEEQREENVSESQLEEAGGEDVENEVERGMDAEEEEEEGGGGGGGGGGRGRQVREEEQVEEEDDEQEEHQEQEQGGRQNHLGEPQRRTEDENIQQNQESTSRQDSIISEEGNSNPVESDAEDSDGDYFNFDRINHEETAVVERFKPSKELEDLDPQSWMNKNSILGGERKVEGLEKFKGEEVTPAAPQTTPDNLRKPQTEEEESTDDEEAEDSEDEEEEGDDDDDDGDVVKVYRKEDHPTDLFRTLTEFKDASVLTDLTLSTKKGKSFHVHSPVLAAVSSRILRCLSRGYYRRNARNKTVGVMQWLLTFGPEVDPVGLEAVVEFAYTGLISCLNNKTLQKIRAAAQTLGAPRVMQLCKQEEEKPFKPRKQREEETIPVEEQLRISLQAIRQLWVDRVGCDVILNALGGSLHVHRVILAGCSDYFRGMFTSGMRESNQPSVTLPNLQSSELEVLIGCSYSGEVPLNWRCVFEITMIALQLQHQPVLSLSLNFLHQEINPHSCLDLASFAEAFEMAQLLEVADDFVLRQFQKVACTKKFKDLPAKQLLKYLNSRSLCVPSELVVFKAVVAWIQARPKVRLKLAKELMKTIHFPLMTFKEFKEVQSLNMWSDHRLAELFEAIFENFCSNESECRIYLPKESLVLIGGDHTSEDLANRSISRELWFGNSLRNHTGVKKAMEWRKLGEMPEPERFSHEVAVLKGQLYVFGGKKYYGLHDNLNSVYRYDPLQNSWESLANMMDRRCSFSVVVLDEKIYAIGGHCDPYLTETVERYCPTTNSWSFSWPLDLPLCCHAAKVLQGQVYVSGGLSNENQYLASMILYNPEAGSTYLANMAKPRARHCMETLGECLYVAGGITANDDLRISDQLACEVYNPAANSWTAFTPLPVPHVGAAGAVLEGKFYVLGGYSQEDYSDTTMVHRYDPATQRWENMGKMPGPNNDIRASVLCLPPHFRS